MTSKSEPEFDTEDTHYLIVRCRSQKDMGKARRAIHLSEANVGEVVLRGDIDNYFGLFDTKESYRMVSRLFHFMMDTSKGAVKGALRKRND